ncbi:MAG: metalloregulator ArsR/SmtB family transcription factor [Actinomycetota bacterium]|nr:metalloregulator ArsR/SmtB family transcription factor [Actinomycetota bacterium]
MAEAGNESAYPCVHTDMTSIREVSVLDSARVEQIREQGLTPDHATALSGTLSLLSEPTRLRILYALDQVGELCVGDLAVALDVGEDSASYALRLLRTAGLVKARKEGRTVFYRLAPDFPEPLLNHCWLQLVQLSSTTKEEL